MRVFVAGATGAIGRPLVQVLVNAGHEVAGLTRRPEKAAQLTAAGATPVVCDLFDPALAAAVADFAPDVVVHEVTDLPEHMSLFPLKVVSLNRARTKGTDILIAAARAAGAQHFVAQSLAFKAPAPVRKAVEYLEAETLAYPGVVLRYGYFYGPGTWYPEGTDKEPRLHVAHAATRTVELLTADPGVYEVTDSA